MARITIRITKAEKLLQVLSDRRWHSTKDLVRRVGHTFGGAKHRLGGRGFRILRRRHPSKRWQHQYRLDPAD